MRERFPGGALSYAFDALAREVFNGGQTWPKPPAFQHYWVGRIWHPRPRRYRRKTHHLLDEDIKRLIAAWRTGSWSKRFGARHPVAV